MATIQIGTHAGRKALDTQVLLVPFIDLLLCCVMFLLVTAVWNDLATIHIQQLVPGGAMDTPERLSMNLTLSVHTDGYELSSASGERQRIAHGDQATLQGALKGWQQLNESADLNVSSDDGVPYAALIDAVDLARGAGFQQLRISSASTD